MPSIFEIQGYKIYFWSNESNEPIHVHISKGKPSQNSTKILDICVICYCKFVFYVKLCYNSYVGDIFYCQYCIVNGHGFKNL